MTVASLKFEVPSAKSFSKQVLPHIDISPPNMTIDVNLNSWQFGEKHSVTFGVDTESVSFSLL